VFSSSNKNRIVQEGETRDSFVFTADIDIDDYFAKIIGVPRYNWADKKADAGP
jgi:hypothetical protein